MKQPRVFKQGERSILLEWEENSYMGLLEHIIAMERNLIKHLPDLEDSQVIYRSLCLHFTREVEEADMEIIKARLSNPLSQDSGARGIWRIPVCYSPEYGPDLEESASLLGLTVDELIRTHCQNVYPVYGIGFLPGFLYLGDVPEPLQLPRKPEPRLKVEAGTVGLAEKQTGIYPQTSPGGWQLLGRTPLRFFDPNQSPPCAIQVGDGVEFYPIDPSTFSLIEIQVKEGIYQPEIRRGL